MAFEDATSWLVTPYSWREADVLARELNLPFVAATVLASRGLASPEEARAFLDCSVSIPDPFLFEHMEGAVTLLVDAVERGRRIVIHGDYDADGITATALMVQGLRDLGVEAEWYLPSRFNEGFGLSRTAVETIAVGGPGVLITVDCGVNYPDEVALAASHGLDVIVVDHHQPGPLLPQCHVIHSAVGRYPHDELSGVGLALKVIHAVHIRRHGASPGALPDTARQLLDLVAVGTIADMATLRGENRYYVKEGLKLIAIGAREGLRALAEISGCAGRIDAGAVAFRLAPRLNAAGRLAEASPPLRLLLTDDEGEAAEIATRLHELNGERQDVEKRIFGQAVTQVEAFSELPPIIVLAGESWHEGVVGIVASRLVERYNRPTILLGTRDGTAKGSGRSIAGYDLMAGLDACAQHLSVYGGHTQAVGLTLRAENVEGFHAAITRHAGTVLGASELAPYYRADAVLRGDDVNADTATALASLGPFGNGNPRPRLLLVGADVHQPETTRTGAHLRCTVELDGVRTRAIGFGLGGTATALREQGGGRVLGVQFRLDEWQGSLRPEFVVERLGACEGGAASLFECGNECSHSEAPWLANGLKPEAERLTVPELPPSPRVPGSPELSIPNSRDLRDQQGRLGALVQVLATGEPALLLVSSVPHTPRDIRELLDGGVLSLGSVECVGQGCWSSREDRSDGAAVAVVEWDVAMRCPAVFKDRPHLVALDPPYRSSHVALLRESARQGSFVHLYYGPEQRQETARLLKYLVHPRFAMVCLYRAMDGRVNAEQLFANAAGSAWRDVRVVLTYEHLARAYAILTELGLERRSARRDKIEARKIPAYASAEAEYEECARLCRNL